MIAGRGGRPVKLATVVPVTEANTLSVRSMRSSGLVASGWNNGTYWTVYRSALVLLVLISANEKASGPVCGGHRWPGWRYR